MKGLREEINEHFPAYKSLTERMCDLLGDEAQPLPPHVHVRSLDSKTEHIDGLIRSVASSSDSTAVTVLRPLTCPTVQHAFRRILLSLTNACSKREAVATTQPLQPSRILAMSQTPTVDVKDHLKRLLSSQGGNLRLVLVLPEAEKLREIWDDVSISCLLDICRMHPTYGKICIVSVSSLGCEHIFPSFGSGSRTVPIADAVQVFSQHAQRGEALDQFQRDIDDLQMPVWGRSKCDHLSADGLRVPRAFSSLIFETFASETRSIRQLGILTLQLWRSHTNVEKYVEKEDIDLPHAVSVLRAHYAGNIIAIDHVDLPVMSCCLLLSSFLASYSPPRTDVQLFVRDDNGTLHFSKPVAINSRARATRKKGGAFKKRRTLRRVPAASRSGDSQLSLGPRSFSLDRLLSICESISTQMGGDKTKQHEQLAIQRRGNDHRDVHVLECINILLRAGLLVRTTISDRLDVITTLRTNVTKEMADDLARQIGIDLSQYFYL